MELPMKILIQELELVVLFSILLMLWQLQSQESWLLNYIRMLMKLQHTDLQLH